MTIAREQHIARLVYLTTLVNVPTFKHVDLYELAIQFGVRPNTIRRDLNIIRDVGLYPDDKEVCELCGKHEKLVVHHWIDEEGPHTKNICNSCNVTLGVIFCGNYPVWEEQVKVLSEQLERVMKVE